MSDLWSPPSDLWLSELTGLGTLVSGAGLCLAWGCYSWLSIGFPGKGVLQTLSEWTPPVSTQRLIGNTYNSTFSPQDHRETSAVFKGLLTHQREGAQGPSHCPVSKSARETSEIHQRRAAVALQTEAGINLPLPAHPPALTRLCILPQQHPPRPAFNNSVRTVAVDKAIFVIEIKELIKRNSKE